MPIYIAPGVVPPRAWQAAAGTSAAEVNVLVVANTRGDVPALLTDRGVRQHMADLIGKAARSRRPDRVPGLQLLIDAGVVDPGGPADVLMWAKAGEGDLIVRAATDPEHFEAGIVTPVARWRRADGRAWIEPLPRD